MNLNPANINHIFILNDLMNISYADYKKVKNEFLESFSNLTYVISIGVFGGIGEPGISDLDCLVIVEDGAAKESLEYYYTWLKEDNIRDYVFWHPPLIATRSMMQHAQYLHTMEELHWEYKSYPIVTDYEYEMSKFLYFVWATYLIPFGAGFLSGQFSSLRKSLLVLKNIIHSCSLIEDNRSIEFIDRNKLLRHKIIDLRSANIIDENISKELKGLFFESFVHLLLLLDFYNVEEFNSFNLCSRKVINSNVSLKINSELSVSGSQSALTIKVPNWLFCLMPTSCVYPSGLGIQAQKYHSALESVYHLARREQISSPFISPFGYRQNLSYFKLFAITGLWYINRMKALVTRESKIVLP